MPNETRMLACLVCGKVPEAAMPDDVDEGGVRAPYGATVFYTSGHYGSTFWDSFEGEQVAVVICDAHLHGAAHERIAFLRPIRQHPTRWVEVPREEGSG